MVGVGVIVQVGVTVGVLVGKGVSVAGGVREKTADWVSAIAVWMAASEGVQAVACKKKKVVKINEFRKNCALIVILLVLGE